MCCKALTVAAHCHHTTLSGWPCRYFNLSGAHALLATNNGPGVVAAYTLSQLPPEKGLRACTNLAGLVPPGDAMHTCSHEGVELKGARG